MKSLEADGTFEGSVYAVPFRTAIEVQKLPSKWQSLSSGERRLSVGSLNDLEGGQQIEITLRVLAQSPRTLNFAVRNGDANGNALPGLSYAIPLQKGARNARFILRSQLPAKNLFITLDVPRGVTNGAVLALRENEQIAHLHRGVMESVRHRGGVTFDVLK